MDTDVNIYNCKERISAGLHHHSWNYTVKSPEGREKYYIRVSVAVSYTPNVCIYQRNLLWLNWISRIVEWVTHYISEGVVQLSEHLRKERKKKKKLNSSLQTMWLTYLALFFYVVAKFTHSTSVTHTSDFVVSQRCVGRIDNNHKLHLRVCHIAISIIVVKMNILCIRKQPILKG